MKRKKRIVLFPARQAGHPSHSVGFSVEQNPLRPHVSKKMRVIVRLCIKHCILYTYEQEKGLGTILQEGNLPSSSSAISSSDESRSISRLLSSDKSTLCPFLLPPFSTYFGVQCACGYVLNLVDHTNRPHPFPKFEEKCGFCPCLPFLPHRPFRIPLDYI